MSQQYLKNTNKLEFCQIYGFINEKNHLKNIAKSENIPYGISGVKPMIHNRFFSEWC